MLPKPFRCTHCCTSFSRIDNLNSHLQKFHNKKKINYINAGVYIIKKSLIKEIDNSKPVSLEKDFFPNVLNKNLQAYILENEKFIDIGTPKSLNKADFFFNKEY